MQPVTPLCSSRFDAVRAASWRLPWSCCNPLLCVCSALQMHQSSKLDGSARFGLTAAPQAKCECFRLHDCIVGRSLHARLQRLCSTAGRQVPGTRCHVAGLLCRTCSQAMARRSSSIRPTHARAAVKFPYVVTAFPINEIAHIALYRIYLRKRLTFLGLISTPDHLQLQHASKAGLHVPCGST